MGVAYNRTLLGALVAGERLGRWWSVDVRAALVGAVVGLLAWFGPGLIGGGDAITQADDLIRYVTDESIAAAQKSFARRSTEVIA
jgi:membrane protein DedA with SNARE-associated domain